MYPIEDDVEKMIAAQKEIRDERSKPKFDRTPKAEPQSGRRRRLSVVTMPLHRPDQKSKSDAGLGFLDKVRAQIEHEDTKEAASQEFQSPLQEAASREGTMFGAGFAQMDQGRVNGGDDDSEYGSGDDSGYGYGDGGGPNGNLLSPRRKAMGQSGHTILAALLATRETPHSIRIATPLGESKVDRDVHCAPLRVAAELHDLSHEAKERVTAHHSKRNPNSKSPRRSRLPQSRPPQASPRANVSPTSLEMASIALSNNPGSLNRSLTLGNASMHGGTLSAVTWAGDEKEDDEDGRTARQRMDKGHHHLDKGTFQPVRHTKLYTDAGRRQRERKNLPAQIERFANLSQELPAPSPPKLYASSPRHETYSGHGGKPEEAGLVELRHGPFPPFSPVHPPGGRGAGGQSSSPKVKRTPVIE